MFTDKTNIQTLLTLYIIGKAFQKAYLCNRTLKLHGLSKVHVATKTARSHRMPKQTLRRIYLHGMYCTLFKPIGKTEHMTITRPGGRLKGTGLNKQNTYKREV